jgi:protein-tyrosine phosphatase
MLSIFRKKPAATIDFSAIGTDMHSHLLPGIDDGARDSAQSAELIAGLRELGFTKFVTTPHVMSDMYPNTPATIHAAHERLKTEAGSGLPLKVAAEYFLDETFDRLMEQNEPLLCIHERHVLVEFSFITTPLNFKERIFNMQIRGYQPVLAHPERYLYFAKDRSMYDELKDAGCLFACNMLSFTGHYGKAPQELGQYLFKKDYIDYLGTDLHHARHLELLQKAHAVMPVIQRLTESGRLLNPKL